MTWQPGTQLHSIRQRAQTLADIRQFFAERNLLEVETPVLSRATIPDPNIHSLSVDLFQQKFYLQTSPEFHMKRLLAYGAGSIYQISRVFRDDEAGAYHNPEFTLLEWYRLGFDHHQLMDEMDAFLKHTLQAKPALRLSYQELFHKYLNLDPLAATTPALKERARQHGIRIEDFHEEDKDFWLYLLMSHCIEPELKQKRQPYFVYDFPVSQAALAKKNPANPQTAERFEVYMHGMELANGFHELTDAKEQRRRFVADNVRRRQLNLPEIPLDENFLQALAAGMPACAGVALGVDRLLMLKLGASSIEEVINFPWARA